MTRALYTSDIVTKSGPEVDARAYGSTTNHTTIQAAVTAIGSDERVLLIAPGTWTITSNTVIPSNVTLKVLDGGVLSTSSASLTINGPLVAGLYQIFGGDLGIVFGATRRVCQAVYPQWFGALGDGSTDDTAAIQGAFNTAYTNGYEVHFPSGTYEFLAASMPATKNCPAIKGIGKVLIELTGDVQWAIKNGFSMEDLDFTTTYTYANATATFYYTWTSNVRLYNCSIRNITFSQTTVADGTARGNGLILIPGVTDFHAENVSVEGIRHGITVTAPAAEAPITRGTFRGIFAKNAQRLLSVGSPGAAAYYFSSTGIVIDGAKIENTAAQAVQFSGGAETGHTGIIGDMGSDGILTNYTAIRPIEHATYLYGENLILNNINTINGNDIKIVGYSISYPASYIASNINCIVDEISWAALETFPLFTSYYVDGVKISNVKIKGTNTQGSTHMIRPICVLSIDRSAKNIIVENVDGQYLNSGIVQYFTTTAWEEAYDGITIQNCHVLDPTTVTTTGYAAINKYLTYYPTIGTYSNGDPLIKNVTLKNNYFGQTTDTAGSADTITVLARGRGGTRLLGLVLAQDMKGLLCENNEIDGWYGANGSVYSPIGVNTAAAGAQGYCQDIVIKESWVTGATEMAAGRLVNVNSMSEGSIVKILAKKATSGTTPIIAGYAEITKGSSVALAAKAVEAIGTQSHIKGYFTIELGAGESYTYGPYTTGAEGLFNMYSDGGEYIIAHFVGATVTALVAVSANAAITDAGSKLCAFPSGGYIQLKNNTAGTEIVTLNFDFAYTA